MKRKCIYRVVCFSLFSILMVGVVLPVVANAEGLKKVVAVTDFEDKAAKTQWKDSYGSFDLGQGLADQLTNSLIESKQFVVLERQTLHNVIEEQDMAASDRFQKSKSARTGKLTSAQILVKGVISEFETTAEQGGSGISFMGVRLGKSSQKVHIGLIIFLVDTTTGEIIDSQRVEGFAKAGGLDIGLSTGGVNFGSDSYKATPLGKATQMAIDSAVEFVAQRLRDVPFKGRVVQVKNNVLYLSAGMNNDVMSGNVFNVLSVGEELIDPSTGELLGVDEVLIGQVKVFTVAEKFSKARAIGDLRGVKIGDTITFSQ